MERLGILLPQSVVPKPLRAKGGGLLIVLVDTAEVGTRPGLVLAKLAGGRGFGDTFEFGVVCGHCRRCGRGKLEWCRHCVLM